MNNKDVKMAMIFILLLCVMFNFSFSEAGKVEFFIDGEKVTQQEFAGKGKNGTIIFYYENGNKKDELEFKNGQKSMEGTNKFGKPDGKWISWNEDGSIKREVTYKDGKVVDF